jgi:hypothetical protein
VGTSGTVGSSGWGGSKDARSCKIHLLCQLSLPITAVRRTAAMGACSEAWTHTTAAPVRRSCLHYTRAVCALGRAGVIIESHAGWVTPAVILSGSGNGSRLIS